jgi:hypothetical protein
MTEWIGRWTAPASPEGLAREKYWMGNQAGL